uniref:Uncharacterized protein n=1 Tax=Coccidioides posadasii RMSCC 3488 TaxID=454284 RepID=A0A0J6FPT0_COCPO|nr:hypothetical protein CPAG_07287 [Coccidioides posadasii RMSCC 3488]
MVGNSLSFENSPFNRNVELLADRHVFTESMTFPAISLWSLVMCLASTRSASGRPMGNGSFPNITCGSGDDGATAKQVGAWHSDRTQWATRSSRETNCSWINIIVYAVPTKENIKFLYNHWIIPFNSSN